MIKLSIAIASRNALPNAFVVWRGFEESAVKAATMGYDGIELALKHADEIAAHELERLLSKNNLEVSCISTGQIYADTGLMFTDPDEHKRSLLRNQFQGIIDLAADFGRIVNIGRVRGVLGNNPAEALNRCIDMTETLCAYADKKNVRLVLEPVNRYETDFINTLAQAAELIGRVGHKNIGLMPDVFHMNIEDPSIGGELKKYARFVNYIHLADSNRQAPGWGHTDFEDIFANLSASNYSGWLSVEILPIPTPDQAAAQAIGFLEPFINRYNRPLLTGINKTQIIV